ncbi:hypothetical protein B0H10DRAFT_1948676 [Mycena sp. CBHHK59/15]|nr:hypothetical protein B0H10DRAFT_1948676 [Mycena sp. CBHHK59/15]
MPAQSTDPTITRAQKRKITVADAEEKARQKQKAFEVEAKASGGRRAKLEANKNAIWNVDQPNSRKRTSSTVEVSDKAKKPRKSASTVQSDAEEDTKSRPEPKTKASSTKRKYAAPTIPIDSDDSEPAAPVKLPKSKSAGKVKQVAEKVTAPTTKSSRAVNSKLPPAKIVADSASEVEASSDEDKGSNSDMADFEDANEVEFLAEVPHVVSKKTAATSVHDSGSENESEDMKMSEVGGAGQLFESAQSLSSMQIDKPKGKHRKVQSDSDDDFPDAAPRRAVRDDDADIALHEAIADGLVSIPVGQRSRRSSTGSWSSGHDLRVPDTDPDDEHEDAPLDIPVKKPRKISAARQKQADLEKPHVCAAPVPKTAHQVKLEKRDPVGAPPPRSEGGWHRSAQIAYPAPGKKDILLNSQTEELQCTSCCKSHQGTTGHYLKYAAILADILLDRVNILRGDIKRTATGLAAGHFQLAGLSADGTKERVEVLLKDHRYIFPVDPKTVQIYPIQRLMTDKPFMHPALRAVIKEATSTQSSWNFRMHGGFSCDGVVCVAYGVPATGERQTIAFTEGAYEDTYRNHMKTLADTRDYAVLRYTKSFTAFSTNDGKSTQPEAGSSATLINLVEVDESD